jgi:phosphorylcholine metabolism protein LicD
MILDKNKTAKRLLLKIYRPTIGKILENKRNKIFKKEGQRALFEMDKVFNELKIEYWLEFGTMLGAVREKDFISHDLDIDLGCFLQDYIEGNEKIFNKYGFKKVREFMIDDGKYGREETYRYNKVDIDIFYFSLDDNYMYCHTFAPLPNKSRDTTIKELGGLLVRELSYPYKGFKKIDFLNKKFLIPANICEHLSASYGANYMIKDENYSNDIATNVKNLRDKIGVRYIYE